MLQWAAALAQYIQKLEGRSGQNTSILGHIEIPKEDYRCNKARNAVKEIFFFARSLTLYNMMRDGRARLRKRCGFDHSSVTNVCMFRQIFAPIDFRSTIKLNFKIKIRMRIPTVQLLSILFDSRIPIQQLSTFDYITILM